MSVPASKSPTQGSNVQLSPEQEGRAEGLLVWGVTLTSLRVPIPLDYCRTQPGSSSTLPCSPNVQHRESLSAKEGTGMCQCIHPSPPLLRQLITLSN